ncbi:MAG: type VI secretion protein, partial [Novosphingobium sp.]|nr:type VI secretion protein [Novosphingobium sp.]
MLLIAATVAFPWVYVPPVYAQSVQGADPAGSGPIVAALGWLQGTLMGNVATAVAVM